MTSFLIGKQVIFKSNDFFLAYTGYDADVTIMDYTFQNRQTSAISPGANMHRKKIFFPFFLALGVFLCINGSVVSADKYSIELEKGKQKELEAAIQKMTDKLSIKVKTTFESEGFDTIYKTPFFSPFKFKGYIGNYQSGTIMRFESPGLSRSLSEILLTELKGPQKSFNVEYKKKSYILGHLLNLALPSAGFIYTHSSSPLGVKSKLMAGILLFIADAGLFTLGSTGFFTHSFDPFGTGLVSTLSLSLGFRVITAIPMQLRLYAHNKVVGLGYHFSF